MIMKKKKKKKKKQQQWKQKQKAGSLMMMHSEWQPRAGGHAVLVQSGFADHTRSTGGLHTPRRTGWLACGCSCRIRWDEDTRRTAAAAVDGRAGR